MTFVVVMVTAASASRLEGAGRIGSFVTDGFEFSLLGKVRQRQRRRVCRRPSYARWPAQARRPLQVRVVGQRQFGLRIGWPTNTIFSAPNGNRFNRLRLSVPAGAYRAILTDFSRMPASLAIFASVYGVKKKR